MNVQNKIHSKSNIKSRNNKNMNMNVSKYKFDNFHIKIDSITSDDYNNDEK